MSLIVFFRHSHRVLRNKTLPMIIEDLSPLNPHDTEIKSVLSKLKYQGHRICKYVNTKTIVNALTRV